MFCKYCGIQIPDGELCGCQEAIAAREAAAQPEPAAAETEMEAVAEVEVKAEAAAEPAAVAETEPAPIAESAEEPAAAEEPEPAAQKNPGTIMLAALKAMPQALKTLVGDSSGAGIDLPCAVIFSVGGLLCNLLSWVCMTSSLLRSLKGAIGSIGWVYLKKLFDGMYGFGILGGLWTCIIPIALSMTIVIAAQLLRKEKISWIPAFIAGSCIHTVPSAIFLVGALISMVLPALGGLVILVGIVAALAGCYRLAGRLVPSTGGLFGGLAAAAVTAVIAALMALVIYGVIIGYIEGPLAENMATVLGGSNADIGDLLGLLLGSL